MRPIFLVGYMGCGKSTIGRTVSRLTGIRFIDLDTYIEDRFHSSISDIFASHGEAGFRDIEYRMLHEVADFEDVLVACGGGTPCFMDNMEYMNSHGVTVFLDTSIDRLHSRLMRGRRKRPLIANKSDDELLSFIVDALQKRRPHYAKAQVRFSSDLLESKSEIENTAKEFIQQLSLNLLDK
jgi:shikimate kinase